MRLSQDERNALAENLKSAGLEAEAEKLAQSAAPAPTPNPRRTSSSPNRPHTLFDYETAEQLQIDLGKKDDVGALALARNVLAALPPPSNPNGGNDNSEYVLRSVVSALDQFKRRADFIADAEKQLAKDPDSVTLNYQLAVLHSDDDSNDEKKFVNRQPGHPSARPPVWLKLAREGEDVVGFTSPDGVAWSEVGRGKFSASPDTLTALAVGGDNATGVFDHVNLGGEGAAPTLTPDASASPSPSPSAADSGPQPLPAPWQELSRTHDDRPEKAPPVPPATWQGGAFSLHDLDGSLHPHRRDYAQFVQRLLGGATEFVARVASVLQGASSETESRPRMACRHQLRRALRRRHSFRRPRGIPAARTRRPGRLLLATAHRPAPQGPALHPHPRPLAQRTRRARRSRRPVRQVHRRRPRHGLRQFQRTEQHLPGRAPGRAGRTLAGLETQAAWPEQLDADPVHLRFRRGGAGMRRAQTPRPRHRPLPASHRTRHPPRTAATATSIWTCTSCCSARW